MSPMSWQVPFRGTLRMSNGLCRPFCIRIEHRRMMSRLSPDQATVLPEDNDESLYGEEEEKPTPWQTLLEPAARAAWRAAKASPPVALAQVRLEVLQQSERTARQLRRTHSRILESHEALAERRERERRRIKNPQFPSDSLAHKKELSRDTVVSPIYYGPELTLAALKHRLLPNYAVISRVLSESKSLIGPTRWKPRRVIDFGVGSGSASAAAMDVFNSIDWVHGVDPSQSMRDSADIILKAISADRSVPARVTLSGSLSTQKSEASQGGFDLAIFAYTAMELPHVASTVSAAAILWEKLRPNGVFVMVEPGTPDGFSSVRTVRSLLLDCCPPGRRDEPGDDQCHVIAPCTHNGECPMERNRRHPRKSTTQVDDEYGDNSDDEGSEHSEVDDCPMERDEDEYDLNEQGYGSSDGARNAKASASMSSETDVFDSAYCSFVHTMPSGSRRSKGEKFSYLVAQKRIVGDLDTDDEVLNTKYNPFHTSSVVDLLKTTFQDIESREATRKSKRESIDLSKHSALLAKAISIESDYLKADDELGLDFLRGDANRKTFGRIIRAPIKNRGHVLLDYCSGADESEQKGRIVRHRVSKGRSSRVAPGLFAAARKARWGGLWPDVMAKKPISTQDEDDDNDIDELK